MNSEFEKCRNASDRSLVEWARDGDLKAFDELVRRYHAPLISFLKFYCSRNTDVEAVAQEAFMKCFTHLAQFDSDRKFKNWLYTIARRTIPQLQTKLTSHPEALDGLIGNDGDPKTLVEHADRSESIWATVRKTTSDDDFQLMWFRYAEQLSIKEIAMVMQRSEDALKMQLSRLRKKLRPHLRSFVESGGGINLFDPKMKAA